MDRKLLEESTRYLAEAVRLYPGHRRYQILLGEAHLLRGSCDEALDALEGGFHTDLPPRAAYLVAVAWLARGNHAEAERFAGIALAASPAFHRAAYIRGRAQLALDRPEEALPDFRLANEGASRRPEARLALTRALVRAAERVPERAEAHLLEATEVLRGFGENPPSEARFLAAVIAQNRGDGARARSLLEHCDYPGGDEIAFRLGISLLGDGDSAGALAAFGRIRAPETLAAAAPWIEKARSERRPAEPVRFALPRASQLWPDPLDPDCDLLGEGRSALPIRIQPSGPPLAPQPRTLMEGPRPESLNAQKAGAISFSVERARTLLTEDRPRKALKLLEQCWETTASPEFERSKTGRRLRCEVATSLFHVWRALGRETRLAETTREFFDVGVRDAHFLAYYSQQLLARGDRASLEEALVFIAALDSRLPGPRDLRQRVLRGLNYALSIDLGSDPNQVAAFVPHLERLHEQRPHLNFPRLYLGRYHYLCKDFGRALPYFDGIGGALGSKPEVLFLKARCAEKENDVERALGIYHQALKRNRDLPHVHFRIGRILLHQSTRAAS